MTVGAALLIGNTRYSGPFPSLQTPGSDVANLGDRLTEIGFETLVSRDATRAEMATAIGRFQSVLERLPPNSSGFVYFAGHGLQRGGENYLVPVDAMGGSVAEALWSCLRLSEIMDALCWRNDQQKWLAIDACRTNELPSGTRDGISGLSGESVRRYERIRETTVLYATEPGHVAQDGGGYGSSPFCRGLLDALKDPYRSVRELTLHATQYVCEATGDMQTPWETACITRKRPFVAPPDGLVAGPGLVPALPPASSATLDPADRYVAERGHLIHKIKAKDTSGRWAYYFILVEPSQEAAFLSAIEGDGILDLETFGRVIASSYGETPSDEVRAYLKERYGFVA